MTTAFLAWILMGRALGNMTFQPKSLSDHPVHTQLVDPDKKICSLNVADLDLPQVLKHLSEETGLNLILLTKPDTRLTLHLTNVPMAEMMRHICAVSSLSWVRCGSTYVVASDAALKSAYSAEWKQQHPEEPPVPVVTPERVRKPYHTNFINAATLKKTLDGVFAKEDLLTIQGPDTTSPQIPAQTGIVSTGSTNDSARSQTADAQQPGRVLVLSGLSATVDSALVLARELDVPRKQVAIDVQILEVSQEMNKDLGINWTIGDVSLQETGNSGIKFGQISRGALSAAGSVGSKNQYSKARLLANPTMSVLDGESGYILIGSRIKYSVLSNPATQYSAAVYTIQEERVGIYLQVAAQISDDGKVTLNLYPQVSTITGYLTVNGSQLPQISTREAKTLLRVNTGESVVMGGLIQEQDTLQVDKFPILGDIPVLGEFFRRRSHDKQHSQIIIRITPNILPSPVPK